MLDSILESLQVISVPTRTNFRSVKYREVALFEGAKGWGEFSPFLEYTATECVPWLVSGIEAAFVTPPPLIRSEIEINATLPAVNDREEVATILSWFSSCKTVKIKVGNELRQDRIRISTVREIMPKAKIRIDVNGSWAVSDAISALHSIYADGDIEFVEQPCATIEELRELKNSLDISVLIAGEEIIRKSANPLEIDLSGAIDILMLKVATLGGIKRSLEIAKVHALPVVVSSALDSAVGISRGIHLAASLPHLDYACGLGTGELLSGDVGSLPITDGMISVRNITPDMSAIRRYAVSVDRVDWWQARIRETWEAGAADWVASEGWNE